MAIDDGRGAQAVSTKTGKNVNGTKATPEAKNREHEPGAKKAVPPAMAGYVRRGKTSVYTKQEAFQAERR